MSGGQRAGGERAAEPLGLVGPAGDLGGGHRLVDQSEHLLGRPVGTGELGEQAAGQLRAHAALAEPHAQVDLLGPEVLGPDVPVHLLQVVEPARPAVRGGVQLGRPFGGRIRPLRDAQVHLGVGHPDRGQRHRDAGGQRLALGRGRELVRDGRHPVISPGVRLGQHDPVVEVPD